MTPFHNMMTAVAALGVGGYQGLTLRQIAMLELLDRSGGAMLHRAIAAGLGVQKPVVTRSAKALENDGLVWRQRGGDDGRDLRVGITARGREVAAALRAAIGG